MGYADLIVALRGVDDERERRQIAAMLGFGVARRPLIELRDGGLGDVGVVEMAPGGLGGEPLAWAVEPGGGPSYWRPDRVEFQYELDEVPARPSDADDDRREILGPDDIGRPSDPKPPPEPTAIAPHARLRRRIEQVHRQLRPVGGVDVDALVDRLAQALPICALPRLAKPVPAARMVVILDRQDRAIPCWDDQAEIYLWLRRELGEGVSMLVWTAGPPAWVHDGEALALVSRDAAADPYAPLSSQEPSATLGAGDVVLVLGDLGHAGPANGRADRVGRWLGLGRALRRCGLATAALLPYPARRWEPGLLRVWPAIDWERPHAGVRAAKIDDGEAALRLLALISWTTIAEPGLLRAVRRSLAGADVGTELDAWCEPQAHRHTQGLALRGELRERAQAKLCEMLEDRATREWFVREVVQEVRRYHAWRPREYWMEEARELARICPELFAKDELEDVEAFTRKVRNSMLPEHLRSRDLAAWVSRSLRSGDDARLVGAWGGSWLGPLLHGTIELIAEHEGWSELPAGADVGQFTPEDRLRRWELRQVGGELQIGDAGRGSPVIELTGYSDWIALGKPARRVEAGRWRWGLEEEEGDEVELRTTGQVVVLRREPKPAWACAAGRDQYGLWAAFRVGEVEQRMRWIPPGRFWMGSPKDEEGRWKEEGPRHLVVLTRGYWMADTPCTQALWEAVMGGNPSHFEGSGRPVEQVSWKDVEQFLAKLEPGFALPTEAQWEYACRAGTTTARYGELDEVAWYSNNAGGKTRDVGLKPANSWGLYDMLGNVLEWCADWFGDYSPQPSVDPTGPPGGHYRVIRGGSWDDTARYVRAASRHGLEPGYRNVYLGFRLVRGQALRPAGERSESPDERSESQQQESKGGEARAGDPPGARPAWLHDEEGQ